MKVLILSQYYWPEQRTAPKNIASLAEDLTDLGHNIQVITGFPNHPLGNIYPGYKLKIWTRESRNGVNILRLPLYPDHSLSVLGRLLNYGSFLFMLLTFGMIKGLLFNPDVVLAYSPPITISIPAFLVSKIRRASLVYWITDLWPESFGKIDISYKKVIEKTLSGLSRWAYKTADHICVNSQGLKKILLDRGVNEDNVDVIFDWADENLFFPSIPDVKLVKHYDLDGKFVIMYAGNLGIVQNLETVVLAAEKLQEEKSIQFVFVGDGTDEQKLKQLVERKELRNVLFIPRQQMEDMNNFLALADVLLVHLIKDPIFENQVPSKILAYLASGKPILCAVSGSAAKIIRDAGAGLVCEPDSPLSIANCVKGFFLMPPEELYELGNQARETYLSNFTRKIQIHKYETILTGLFLKHK